MTPGAGRACAALLLVAACGRAPAPPGQDAATQPPESAVPDSLALTTADGYQVWLTDVRPARDSAGGTCQERSVEIRRDTVRLRVPLLYVRVPPTLLDPRHLRAELSRDCRTTAIYRVELATARPYKIEDR